MKVTATIEKQHYLTTIITEGNHQILADEPASENGTNFGPSPDELLMMSLASCTAITLRMYADRKNWNVSNIRVQVNMQRIEGKTIFTRNVEVNGALDETEKMRMLAIANACPVHKTLTNPIEINTTLN